MLAYARNASPTQQKRAFETLLEFLELDAVGDPLEKVSLLVIESYVSDIHPRCDRPRNNRFARRC